MPGRKAGLRGYAFRLAQGIPGRAQAAGKPSPKLDEWISAADWNEGLRNANRFCDSLIKALGTPGTSKRAQVVAAWKEELKNAVESPDTPPNTAHPDNYNLAVRLSNYLVWKVMGDLGRYRNAVAHVWVRQSRWRAALAAFKAENGNYPESLAQLSPKYLKTVPKDPFSDQDLIYKLKRTGSCSTAWAKMDRTTAGRPRSRIAGDC